MKIPVIGFNNVARFALGIALTMLVTPLATAAIATGTGFFITSNGYIVTNNHVIEGADAISVRDYRGKTYTANVKHVDHANDLAILKVDGSFSPLPVVRSSTMRRGDSVFTLGFPNTQLQGSSVKFTDGTISALSGIVDEPNNFQMSVPIQPGNSGGPLINRDGAVVGVVVAKLSAATAIKTGAGIPEAVNYSVKSNYLLELIDADPSISEAIQAPASKKNKQLALPDIVSSAEQSVVFIVVNLKGSLSAPVQQAQESGQNRAPIVVSIAHVGPLTGVIAHLGRDNERGAQLAVDEINASGLVIGGRPASIRLLTEDDGADPRQAVAVAQRLAQAHVAGVVGNLNSGTTITASKIYSDAGIPQVAPSATNPKYTRQGFRTAFRVIADDLAVAHVIGQYGVRPLGGRTVAVIDDRTAYGINVADAFAAAASAAGATVVAREYTSDKPGDYSSILANIKQRNVDTIYFGGMDAVAGPILRQMRSMGIGAKFIGGDGICSTELVKMTSGYVSDDQVYCAQAGGVGAEGVEQLRDFKSKFKSRFGTDTLVYSPYTYDGVKLLVDAMVRAGSSEPAKYLPFLAATSNYQGVTGPIGFDAKGDLQHPATTLKTIRGGRLAVVGIPPASQ